PQIDVEVLIELLNNNEEDANTSEEDNEEDRHINDEDKEDDTYCSDD
ncbi:hypothetical protein A2U01_0104586, partial [Trifolium medium]|nr:hypothetical protein [Trifolium medium]